MVTKMSDEFFDIVGTQPIKPRSIPAGCGAVVENPYHEQDGWYWWDETGDAYGPYNTRDHACRDLRDYCDFVLGTFG